MHEHEPDPSEIVQTALERVVRENARPAPLSRDDIVFTVVGVRCEMDMSGFESVFEQVLDSERLDRLVSYLDDLDEPDLAVTAATRRRAARCHARRIIAQPRSCRVKHGAGERQNVRQLDSIAFGTRTPRP